MPQEKCSYTPEEIRRLGELVGELDRICSDATVRISTRPEPQTVSQDQHRKAREPPSQLRGRKRRRTVLGVNDLGLVPGVPATKSLRRARSFSVMDEVGVLSDALLQDVESGVGSLRLL